MTTAANRFSPGPSLLVGQLEPDVRGYGPVEYQLVPSRCSLCQHDDAEPVAVGRDFTDQTSRETFLAVCCRTCGLVYLNPQPVPRRREMTHRTLAELESGSDADWRNSRTIGREIARFCRKLPDHGRLLDIGCGEGGRLEVVQRALGANWQLEGVDADRSPHAPEQGAKFLVHPGRVEELDLPDAVYDAVLLIGVVENADNPLTALKAVKELLRPGGLVLIATPNTRSTVCSLFRGRHWSGYSFPWRRSLFDGKSLGRAAGLAGLGLVSVHTSPAASAWIESARNLMVDWEAPEWALALVGQPSGAARAAAAAIEWSQQIRSKGGLLVATLRRSEH